MSLGKRRRSNEVLQDIEDQVEAQKARQRRRMRWKLAAVALHVGAFYANCYCALDYVLRVRLAPSSVAPVSTSTSSAPPQLAGRR